MFSKRREVLANDLAAYPRRRAGGSLNPYLDEVVQQEAHASRQPVLPPIHSSRPIGAAPAHADIAPGECLGLVDILGARAGHDLAVGPDDSQRRLVSRDDTVDEDPEQQRRRDHIRSSQER